jgi:hypothetical protein
MMNILRHWLVSLNQAERSLRSQGYVVVYGGMTSVVVPAGSSREPPWQCGQPPRGGPGSKLVDDWSWR